jgi:hypothetical protein
MFESNIIDLIASMEDLTLSQQSLLLELTESDWTLENVYKMANSYPFREEEPPEDCFIRRLSERYDVKTSEVIQNFIDVYEKNPNSNKTKELGEFVKYCILTDFYQRTGEKLIKELKESIKEMRRLVEESGLMLRDMKKDYRRY